MNKIVNHPIWSKVIAGVILMFIGWIVTVIQKIDWQQIRFTDIQTYWNKIPIATVLIVLSAISIAWALFEIIKRLILYIKRKIQKEKHDDTSDVHYFNSNRKTTDFFSGRVSDSFPGIRGFKWINNAKTAIERLEILLRKPLKFRLESYDEDGGTITPIWWFSRGSSSEIDTFKVLRYPMLFGLIRGKVLIGWDEYVINKIGIYHSSGRYYQDMVYVETYPDRRTGLYKKSKDGKKFGRFPEEYALFNGKKITREEYDDGSAIIKGKPVNCYGSELRARNLARDNFIICAKYAPYNSPEFDHLSMQEFDGILEGKKTFEEVFEELKKLPRIDNHRKH